MSTKLEERPVEQEHYVRERGLERLEELKSRRGRRQQKVQERLRDAAQSKLVWHRFKKHKIAPIALWLLILLYATALLSDFVAPHSVQQQFSEHQYNPPTLVRVIDREGSWHMPFIYETETALDPATFSYKTTIPDDAERFPVRLWVPSEEYRLLGFIPMDHRLFGTGEDAQPLLLWGSDNLGRDLFSRIVIASKVSLFVGLAGVLISSCSA